ncbi:MAG: anthranilate synthase component I [Thermoleophilia bacterium]|nr:anthranilate synthase component I [Thermoleophilia bacterium]
MTLRLDVAPRAAGSSLRVRPSVEEVRALAREHRQVPLVHTYIADCETPVSAMLKLRDGGPCFLLESAEEGQRLGRYSMIGVRPQGVIRAEGDRLVLRRADGGEEDLDAGDPFGAVQRAVAAVGTAPPPEELAFWGGAVGYFAYDLVRRVERLPDVPEDDLGVPDMAVMITGPVVLFDHLRRSLTIIVPCPLDPDADPEPAYWRTVAQLAEIKARLAGPVPRPEGARQAVEIGPVTSNVTRERFEAGVERVREYVFAGDCFQVVPSQRFSARVGLDPLSIYRGLRTVNPSPYMFYLDLGDVQLVGSSPEMLVKVEGGVVETRPIAGTRPRGMSVAEDQALAAELLEDPKERAEHVMLVDLGRNDLGRVCAPGTVRVKELMAVELYSHVMHIESTVTGELAAGRHAVDALRAAFPAGTLSGAPKVRAMEIIDELETTKRGPYGGAVGYLGFGGDLDTCITIRTLVCRDGAVHVQAGAGIVADSVPESEFAETQRKAQAMFRAIEVAAEQEDW